MMREHFIVDNSTTPDWEVIPLGPVDKEGRKVSLSTATLFADSGMELTVRRYEYLLGAGVWRACCDEGVVRVDDMHLIRPDTFGALMNDIQHAINSPLVDEEPAHAYNVVSETCRACNGICGGKLCQIKALHSICHRIQSLLAGDCE